MHTNTYSQNSTLLVLRVLLHSGLYRQDFVSATFCYSRGLAGPAGVLNYLFLYHMYMGRFFLYSKKKNHLVTLYYAGIFT